MGVDSVRKVVDATTLPAKEELHGARAKGKEKRHKACGAEA